MSISRMRKIYIMSVLFLTIFFARCTLSAKFHQSLTKETTTRIANCLKITVENVFVAPTNLHLIISNNQNHQDTIRILYKHFSFVAESKMMHEKSNKRFMIIDDNQESLTNRFEEPSLSKWDEYLIVIKSTFSDVSNVANFLYRMEFYFVAFVLIDSHGNVTIIQFQSRANNNNDILSTIECDDEFLKTEMHQKRIRRFNKIVCPPVGCTLTYWKLVSEAPNNLTYIIYKNGTAIAYSVAADILEEFAAAYQVRVTKDLNNSIIDTSWGEGVKAVLNDSIDILFGFSMPTSQDVQPIMVSTWNRFYYLGLLYVPEYNTRSTGFASFFFPLETQVWICFVLVIFFYGLFILSVRYIYKKKLISEYLKAEDLVRIFLKQDLSETRNGGLRFAMGLMLLFGLLITLAYESTITSSFMVKSPPILLDSLTDLCKSGRRCGGPKFIRKYLVNGSSLCTKNLHDRYEAVNVTTIIDMMHFQKVVMMHNVDINNYAIWVYRDRFYHRTSKYPFVYYPSLFFTKKDHPFNSLLKHYNLNFQSSGLQKKLQNKYKLGHQLCEGCQNEIAEPLTISQLSFCWFSLFIGWITSFIILSIELLVNKLMKSS